MDHQPNQETMQSTTNINEVKQQNAASGLTYNEVKKVLAQKISNQDEEEIVQNDVTF